MALSYEKIIACAEYVRDHYNGKDKEKVQAEMNAKIEKYKKEQAKEQGK